MHGNSPIKLFPNNSPNSDNLLDFKLYFLGLVTSYFFLTKIFRPCKLHTYKYVVWPLNPIHLLPLPPPNRSVVVGHIQCKFKSILTNNRTRFPCTCSLCPSTQGDTWKNVHTLCYVSFLAKFNCNLLPISGVTKHFCLKCTTLPG